MRQSDTCRKGHPYTPENTRVVEGGWRQCRTCDRERAQARRAGRPKLKRTLAEYCLRGHSLAGENLYFYSTPNGPQRRCRECDNVREERYRNRGNTSQPRKDTCANGHPMSGDNLSFRANGFAVCRACALLATERYNNAHREKVLARKRSSNAADIERIKSAVLSVIEDAGVADGSVIPALESVLYKTTLTF